MLSRWLERLGRAERLVCKRVAGMPAWRLSLGAPVVDRCGASPLLLVLLMASGCATVPREVPLEVTLALNADSYQIGEPALATVTVTDKGQPASGAAGQPDVLVPALDDTTLRFHVAQQGSPLQVRRKPVLPQTCAPEPHALAGGQSVSRTFLFTRLTEEPGQWALVVTLSGCQSPAGAAQVMPAYYSKMAEFRVADTVMFKRDSDGLITKEQAVALVRKHAGCGEDVPARVVPVPLEGTGLYVWTVFLGSADDPLRNAAAFTVNPYSGLVGPLELAEPSGGGGGR